MIMMVDKEPTSFPVHHHHHHHRFFSPLAVIIVVHNLMWYHAVINSEQACMTLEEVI